MILFSHPKVDDPARHTARALAQAGVLGECWTYRAAAGGPTLHRVAPTALDGPSDVGDGLLAAHGHGCTDLGRALDGEMRERLQAQSFAGVYAYAGAAEASFREAGRRGMLRIYDVPWLPTDASHPLLVEEAELQPDWAETLPPPCATGRVARAYAELAQADLVFVPNTFALESLDRTCGLGGAVAVAVPGAPAVSTAPLPNGRPSAALRVLYAGPLSLRGGLTYAFRACRSLGTDVSLTIAGRRLHQSCVALDRVLGDVRWTDASGPRLQEEMEHHDVFLFPAICDASSEYLLQALAAGLPIVATPHSAAPDLVDDGEEGFIVPIRSVDAIADKLRLLGRDVGLRADMSARCRARAAELAWSSYEGTVAATVACALGRRS